MLNETVLLVGSGLIPLNIELQQHNRTFWCGHNTVNKSASENQTCHVTLILNHTHSGASHSHTMYVISFAVKHCNSKLTSLLPARTTLQGIKQPHTASSMVWPGETDTIHPTSSL